MKYDMSEAISYRGLVKGDQTDSAGNLGIDGAASIVVDAMRGFMSMRRGPGDTVSSATTASMNLRKDGEGVVRVGELAVCSIDASAQTATARLQGPRGCVWRAELQLTAAVPEASDEVEATASADRWPPMRLMRPMRRQDCDQAGHVNVRVFMELVEEATQALLLDAAKSTDKFTITQVRISFKRELFDGDVVTVHSGIRGVGRDGIDAVHAILHQPSGLPACIVETRLSPASASAEGIDSWTDPALDRLSETVDEWPTLSPARPPGPPRAGARPAADAASTVMSVVDSWDCDASGRLSLRSLVSLCSSGARQYLATIGLNGARFLRDKVTVAAVDYLIDVPTRPPLGCNLTVRSAFLSASAKSIRFSHHLLDSDDGTVYATVEIVGVMLDLAAHRSMEIPQDVKQRLALV